MSLPSSLVSRFTALGTQPARNVDASAGSCSRKGEMAPAGGQRCIREQRTVQLLGADE